MDERDHRNDVAGQGGRTESRESHNARWQRITEMVARIRSMGARRRGPVDVLPQGDPDHRSQPGNECHPKLADSGSRSVVHGRPVASQLATPPDRTVSGTTGVLVRSTSGLVPRETNGETAYLQWRGIGSDTVRARDSAEYQPGPDFRETYNNHSGGPALVSGYKKYSSYLIAIITFIINHFVMKQPSPELDQFVALVTALYNICESALDTVRSIVALVKHWIGVPDPEGKPNG